MNGVLIEYFLGLYFLVTGLAQLSSPSQPNGTQQVSRSAVVLFLAGVLLVLFAFLHKSVV